MILLLEYINVGEHRELFKYSTIHSTVASWKAAVVFGKLCFIIHHDW